MVNSGRSVYANVAKGSSTKLGTDDYALKQIVFHLPSEHTVDGKRHAMEIQFVHTQGPKKLLMVSILVRPGERNDVFFSLMAKAPGKLGTQALQAPADPNALLPKTRSLFRYRGSLTMPPCTENVDWLVFAEPLEVAQADIDVFKLIFSMNARPVQSINRRFLLKGVI
jgi:carbonic anhydrase